jgi:hypothetical protein
MLVLQNSIIRPTSVSLPVYKSEITAVGDPWRWPRGVLYPQKMALISPTGGGRKVGIVRSQTQATKLVS